MYGWLREKDAPAMHSPFLDVELNVYFIWAVYLRVSVNEWVGLYLCCVLFYP